MSTLPRDVLDALSRVRDTRILVQVSPNRYRMPILDEIEESLGRELSNDEAMGVFDMVSNRYV